MLSTSVMGVLDRKQMSLGRDYFQIIRRTTCRRLSSCAVTALVASAWLVGSCSDRIVENPRPGVTETELLLGSSSALEGHADFLGTQYTRGSQIYFNEVNAAGGIHGRQIRLLSLDDGYDPPRTVENTRRLIDVDQVFMLFGYVGTPTSVKIIGAVHAAEIPAFGFFTGAEALRTPFRTQMFHVRASYYGEAEAAVRYFVDILGLRNLAVMYQDDAFGLAVLSGIQLALHRRDMGITSIGTYERGTMAVERAVETIAASQAEAVLMVGTSAPLAHFVKLSHERGFEPYFHTVSFVGSEAFSDELREVQQIEPSRFERIIVTQVVPSPFIENLAAIVEYRRLAEKYFPEDPLNYVALEGFVNARVLVEALQRAGPHLTREKLIDTIEALEDLDVGIGETVSYGVFDHQGLDAVFYSRLHEDGTFRTFSP